ncbi:glycosyltransferase family 4 protein [Thermodesulfobacteriota bacterium]
MGNLKLLDYINLGYIWFKTYPSLRRVWSGNQGDSQNIRVNYGHDRVPGSTEQVFGGLVKLQDLSQVYPQSLDSPNILYLVSSALPYFPVRLVRMAKKAGAAIVLNQNGVAYPGWYGEGYQKENEGMAYVHSVADYVFYQSEFCAQSAEMFLGERRADQQSEILYNPVNTDVFRPLDNFAGRKATTILLSGSHWKSYRVFTAVDTLKMIVDSGADVSLKIAGRFCWRDDPGTAEKEVHDYARSAGVADRVILTGPYAQNDAPALMNSCTVLLHTKYNDPCPRLVVEAMACGLPVVYSATGGVAELVGESAGVGIPGPLDWDEDHPPKAEDLAQGILRVLENLDDYSRAARLRAVGQFDVVHWIGRHQAVLNEILQLNNKMKSSDIHRMTGM